MPSVEDIAATKYDISWFCDIHNTYGNRIDRNRAQHALKDNRDSSEGFPDSVRDQDMPEEDNGHH